MLPPCPTLNHYYHMVPCIHYLGPKFEENGFIQSSLPLWWPQEADDDIIDWSDQIMLILSFGGFSLGWNAVEASESTARLKCGWKIFSRVSTASTAFQPSQEISDGLLARSPLRALLRRSPLTRLWPVLWLQ